VGDETVRVRFAPSPTGALHIGGARTAYFNWLFARQNHGVFVLRIDDTDKERSTEASYEQILSSLRWLGIDWDEGPDVGGTFGPYRQSLRQPIYEAELQRMIDEDKVYPCFCSQETLRADREEAQKNGVTPRYAGRCRHLSKEEIRARLEQGEKPVYRLRVPADGETVVEDMIRGSVVFSNQEMDDFIVWKADGTPVYHFASCIDDALLKITHIIRAEEHLSNTPRHVVLFAALGYPVPKFAHVPMILAPDRSKLSKRHGATSVEEYRDAGILGKALINYLLLLGFSPAEGKEIMKTDEAIKLFDLGRVAKHAAIYDVKKLEWMNAHYFRAQPVDELIQEVWPDLVERGYVLESETRERIAWIRTVCEFMQEKTHTRQELVDALFYYFEDVTHYDEKGVKKHFTKPEVVSRLQLARERLRAVEPFTTIQIELAYRALIEELEIKSGDLIHPTRLAISGLTGGPGLFDLMAILGKEACIERMDKAASRIQGGEFQA
jgi:glutamyl-tRNA synthetase